MWIPVAIVVGLGIAVGLGAGCGRPLGIWQQASTDPCADLAGYQADAPWPTACRCPSQACYSPALGPADPEVAWRLEGEGWVGVGMGQGSLTISNDGTIYGVRLFQELLAITRHGEVRWRLTPSGGGSGLVDVYHPAAQGEDGTIILRTSVGVIALDEDGGEKWRLASESSNSFGPFVLGDGGVVYVAEERSVKAVGADAEVLWSSAPTDTEELQGLSYGPHQGLLTSVFRGWDDGYAATALFALDREGALTEFAVIEAVTARIGAVGVNQDVYTIGAIREAGARDYPRLYALGADGTERWAVDYPDHWLMDGPSLGRDGTLYFTYQGSTPEQGWLEARRADGTLRWSRPVADFLSGRPLVDGEGNLYLGAEVDGQGVVLSLNDAGEERWRLPCPGRLKMVGAMDHDGTLYVADQNGVFAIRERGLSLP